MANTQILSTRTIADANTLLAWIQSFICQPHPQLGRKGAICPFAQPALDNNTLDMVFHYEVDGQSLADIETITQNYIQIFLDRYPMKRPNDILQTLLIVFPNIPAKQSTIIDTTHQALKSAFVQHGLMLGQFHMTCPEPSVWNANFPVMTSPLPFFAIRHMAQHDVLFLHQRTDWFSEYATRMGNAYQQGKVSNQIFINLYEEARQYIEEQNNASSSVYSISTQ